MPERSKAVDNLARTLSDSPSRPWNAKLGTKPEDLDEAAWDNAQKLADRVYVDLIEDLDFNRLLIETEKRHLTLHAGKDTFMASADIGFTSMSNICGPCLREVLLALDTNPPWTEQAESPRYVHYQPEYIEFDEAEDLVE